MNKDARVRWFALNSIPVALLEVLVR